MAVKENQIYVVRVVPVQEEAYAIATDLLEDAIVIRACVEVFCATRAQTVAQNALAASTATATPPELSIDVHLSCMMPKNAAFTLND